MTITKKILAGATAAAFVAATAFGLTGCGEDVAATWAHGKILEDDVTAIAERSLSSYAMGDDTYDVESWTAFIANREYDASAAVDVEADAEEDADAVDQVAEEESVAEETAAEEMGDGTLQDYREYIIRQLVRDDLIQHEIEEADIQVSSDELDERVAREAAMYEMYYGGGFSGTFESILEVYMGMDMETFRGYVEDTLVMEKYEMQVLGVESADEIDAEEFDAYIDGLMDYAEIEVKDCPGDLSYDPENLTPYDPADIPFDTSQLQLDATASEDDSAETGESGEQSGTE